MIGLRRYDVGQARPRQGDLGLWCWVTSGLSASASLPTPNGQVGSDGLPNG